MVENSCGKGLFFLCILLADVPHLMIIWIRISDIWNFDHNGYFVVKKQELNGGIYYFRYTNIIFNLSLFEVTFPVSLICVCV